MSAFRAFRVNKHDDLVKGSVEQVTLDDICAGDVVIKAEYSSVNYKDALAATGKGKLIREFPLIGGIDVAGTVSESSDARFSEGDAVLVTGYELGTGHDGGYSEYVRVPANWVIPIPANLSAYDVMAMGTAGFTTAICVKRLEENGLSPEQGPFVVTGATGGVGSFAVNILSNLGYEVVAVTGKKESHDELKALGASRILDRNEIDVDGPPLQKGEWGGAIDNVGGDLLAWLTRSMKPWTSIASVGLAGGAYLNTTVMPFILRGVSLIGISSSNCVESWRQPLWERLGTDLRPPDLDKIVSSVIGMDDLPTVFDDMLAGKTTGRILVDINK